MLDRCDRINRVVYQDGSRAYLLMTKTSHDTGFRDGFDVDLGKGCLGASRLRIVEVQKSTPVYSLEDVKQYCQDHKIWLKPENFLSRGFVVRGFKNYLVNDLLEIGIAPKGGKRSHIGA